MPFLLRLIFRPVLKGVITLVILFFVYSTFYHGASPASYVTALKKVLDSPIFLAAVNTISGTDSGTTAPGTDALATDAADPAAVSTSTALYRVVRVVDGDTIVVQALAVSVASGASAGVGTSAASSATAATSATTAEEKIRFIGINAPESVDPRTPVQCFGKEASAYLKTLLTRKNVLLVSDATQGTFDKYARRLAYVVLPDGTNINKKMIADGYAYEYTYDAPYQYQAEFKAAEKNAREGEKGLWGKGMCGGGR